MFGKRYECEKCKSKYHKKKLVNFAGKLFCSEKCLGEYCRDISTEELLMLDKIDRGNK